MRSRRFLRGVTAAVVAATALVAVTPGPAQAAVSLQVTPTTGLRDGSVLRVTGTASAGTRVYVAQCANRTPLGVADCDTSTVVQLTTDAQGRFGGRFTVREAVNGQDCTTGPGVCAVVAAQVDDLSDNEVVALSFAPPARAALSGTVHDDTGVPAGGAEVQVCWIDGWWCRDTLTDAEGRYRFGSLRAGVVQLAVYPPDGGFLLPTYPEELLALLRAGTATVYDVELRRGGLVDGTFEEADGSPVPVMSGSLCSNESCPSYVGPGAQLGTFRSGVTPTGTYQLSLYDTESNLSQLDGVAVTEGTTTTVRVQRPRRAAVSGTVTYFDGSPAAGTSVSLCTDDSGPWCALRSTFTDDEGRYRFGRLDPGTYALEVRPNDDAPARVERFGGVVVNGTDDVVRNLRLARAAVLTVTLSGDFGARDAAVCPVVGPEACRVVSAYGDGRTVTVGGLSSGEYDVQARGFGEDRFTGARTGVTVGAEGAAITVNVARDGDEDNAADAGEALGGGDGNGDGIADANQSEVQTLAAAAGGGTWTIEQTSPMNMAVLGGRGTAVPTRVGAFALDHGALAAHIDAYGSDFKLRLRMPAAADALLWRNPAGAWKRLDWDGQTGANVADAWVDLRLTDGARGDSDAVRNGVINLQVAPADFDGPAATIMAGPAGRTAATTASFEVAAPDGAALQCSWDWSAFGPCDRTPSRSGLEPGWHTFAVISSGGGSDGLGDYRVWLVGEPSATRITTGPAGAGFGRSATFSLARGGAASTWCVLDLSRSTPVDCRSGTFTARNLAIGPHFLVVVSTDGAGRVLDYDVRQWTVNRSEDLARYRASRALHRLRAR